MSAAIPNPFLTGLLAALRRPVAGASSDQYLRAILVQENVSAGILSPANQAYATLAPIIQHWAGTHLSLLAFSGSFAKGTANRSNSDLDLLISLRSDCSIPLEEICTSLRDRIMREGYPATLQNVSVGTTVWSQQVDLVPAHQRNTFTNDHSLFHKRTGTWRKTNFHRHVSLVSLCGRTNEIRLLKLWRDQKGLEFPSFYLELAVIRALRSVWYGSLSEHVLTVLDYLADGFALDRFEDPANGTNVISDDLSHFEKLAIKRQAQASLCGSWAGIVL